MKSIGHKLLSGSVLRVANFGAQMLATFLLSPFIIHSLGDRLYGFWAVIGTFVGYYGLIDFGLSVAVNRYLARALAIGDDKEIKRVFNTAIRLMFGLANLILIFTVIAIAVTPRLMTNPEDVSLFRSVMLILGCNLAISFLVRVYIGSLEAQMNFIFPSLVNIATLVVRSLLIVGVLLAGYDLLALAWVTFFSSTVCNLVYFYYGRKKLPALRFEVGGFNRDTARTFFSYSFFLLISQVANQLRFHIDNFVIASFLSLSAVTHYSIASTLVFYFNSLVSQIMNVFTPLFSHYEEGKTQEEIKELLYFATRISVGITSFIGFGMVAWGKPFIQRWMGLEYTDAYPSLVVLTLAIVSFLWQLPAHSYLYASSRHKVLAVPNLLEGLFNLGLSITLVKPYGFFGVALGTFFSLFLNKMIVFPICLAKVSLFSYVGYMKNLLLYVAQSCIALVVPIFITFFLVAPDYGRLFLVGFLSAFSYGVCTWFILLSKTDRTYFINSLNSLLAKGKPPVVSK